MLIYDEADTIVPAKPKKFFEIVKQLRNFKHKQISETLINNQQEYSLLKCTPDYINMEDQSNEFNQHQVSQVSQIIERKQSSKWTKEEDNKLKYLKENFSEFKWKDISSFFINKKAKNCLTRWHKVAKPELIKGKFSKDEDDILLKGVQEHGNDWQKIKEKLINRSSKQIRERWINYLNPINKVQKWNPDNDRELLLNYVKYKSKWHLISK